MNKILGDRYEIIEKIGEGGMAYVYKAKCRLLNRYVAIKILKHEFVEDKQFIESFRRESQASAGINHPNIVNIYDVGVQDDIHYIVMEYVEGVTLSSIIEEEGRLDPYEAVVLSKQIASALSCAHKRNIIHRDIKPHNIVVDFEGTAKITDFGIAKAVSSGTLVAGDKIMGSVHYFSPEQAKGNPVDGRSDLYSLGIVMYEMITGKVPFDADNPVSVAMMQIRNEMPHPSDIIPDMSPALERVILKATQKNPADRFSSADEMLAAIKYVEDHGGQYAGMVFDEEDDLADHDYYYENDVLVNERDDNTLIMDGPIRDDGNEDGDIAAGAAMGAAAGAIGGAAAGKAIKKSKKELKAEKKAAKKAAKLEKKKNKKKKITLPRVLGVIFGIVLAVFASFGLLQLKEMVFVPEVTVPEIVGMDYQQAEKLLDSYGLGMEITDEQFSNVYEHDQIIEQNPDEGTEVKKGSKVQVIICKLDADTGVPDLRGQTLENAKMYIESYGYVLGEVTYKDSDADEGIVLEQDPVAGTALKLGSKVNLVLSSGPKEEMVTMLALKTATLDRARELIANLGLKVGDIDYEYSDYYAEGLVLEQSVKEGESVAKGSKVDLVVSRGSKQGDADEDDDQDVAKKTFIFQLPYSNAENDQFTIRINMVKDGVVTVLHEGVHEKKNQGETIPVKGNGKATIKIYYDNKLVTEGTADFDTGKFTYN